MFCLLGYRSLRGALATMREEKQEAERREWVGTQLAKAQSVVKEKLKKELTDNKKQLV